MKKTNKCMKMGLLAAALLAGVMMGCSNVSNSGSGDSSGSGNGGQGGGDVQINDKYDTVWTLNANFEMSGLGTYTFVTGREWAKSDKVTAYPEQTDETTPKTPVDAAAEYWADSTGTSGGLPVAEMKVYQYRGDNPLLTADEEGKYYNSDIIKNFRFYRFSGSAGIPGVFIQPIDNFIIAVDAATDFVYAYAKIVKSSLAPTAFAAVETDKDGTPFYQLDPIGYVNDNGTVTLYQEYQDEITTDGVNYFPSVHTTGLDKAEKKADGFGRSPYYTK